VKVTLLLPGGVSTNIMDNSGVKSPSAASNSKYKVLSADKAASMMIEAIEQNKSRKLIGSDSKMMDFLYRLAPTWASRFIAKKMASMK
jgi:short-subunit dehydrogenase